MLSQSRDYKHFLSISSQLAFCAAPIRLDSYNTCQFSCDYCFAAARTGHGRSSPLLFADPFKLERRLQRVFSGEIRSALDEFLLVRTPIQFGGMSDPFIELERKVRTTLNIIRVLKMYQYPFLMSTKGTIIFDDLYLRELKDTNSLIRFSFSGCSKETRGSIDRGAIQFEEFLTLSSRLQKFGIKFGVRIQPIIPGQEDHAIEMIRELKDTNVKHISCEYLKVPPSARKHFGSRLQRLFGGDIIEHYRKIGAEYVGNEYTLNAAYRKRWLDRMANESRKIGATFGYADNDLLLFSDGNGCCSGSDLHLNDVNNFAANTLGILRYAIREGKKPDFDDIEGFWIPRKNIAQYLNSKSRIRYGEHIEKEWMVYARAAWNGEWGPFNKDFFIIPE